MPSDCRLLAVDDDIQYCWMQMGKLEELIEKFAFCPYCKHKVTFMKAAHRATACVAHLQCEGPCTHYFKWGSQFIGEGDYILNKLAVAAEFLSAGSLTQFNQRQGMLRGAKMHSVYYYDCVTNLVVPRVQIEAEAELEKQKEMLAALPFEQCGISTDWRRDSARRAAHGTNTTIAKHNHKIVDIRNQETKSTTGNAWKNEAHGMVHMLADFVDRKIELSSVDHDDCSTTSKIIDLYKSMMKQEHNIDARTVDNNDNWHGAKSYKKLWHSFVDQFTKPVFRASKRRNQTADSRDSIEAKEIARRQLRAASDRVRLAGGSLLSHARYSSSVCWNADVVERATSTNMEPGAAMRRGARSGGGGCWRKPVRDAEQPEPSPSGATEAPCQGSAEAAEGLL